MNIIYSIFIIILFGLLFYYPLRIYLYIRKYRKGVLGLLFTHHNETIKLFKIFTVSMAVLVIYTFLGIIYWSDYYTAISIIQGILSLVLSILLIYVFYKMFKIMKLIDAEIEI